MFKTVQERVWAFDMEWVPDARAGRLLHPERTAGRDTEAEVPSQAGVPGDVSGRHLLQGRNPAFSAAAAQE